MKYAHTFHIPVMGIGYTIDTPVRVAHFGISSVISLVDDMLMEKMREFHSRQMNVPFKAISSKIEDFRAKRITAYLDLMDKAVKQKVQGLKDSLNKKGGELEKYLDMLPDTSEFKMKFQQFVKDHHPRYLKDWLAEHLPVGSIDVNIMTKLDKENYKKGNKLPAEFNDAHAALRGFANSTIQSSLILSAGMNPRLYSYLEEFEGFYPDRSGNISKQIILKVSDYRSALIQGKFLAKKGLWVSEYRVESGLNCGGHAFATQGHLLGPILEEFRQNRESLVKEIFQIFQGALKSKDRVCPDLAPQTRITAQGGVGTSFEHNFLIQHYNLDSIGWGSPFLLVPEAISIDRSTLKLLCDAQEKDLYLSNISPLGVPFNTVKGNTKDIEKQHQINSGNPGSICTKRYACLNMEYTDKPICTASRTYQEMKIASLNEKDINFKEYLKEYKAITDKSCICVGLGTSALLVNDLDTHSEGPGVSVCPGPNIAWFNKEVSLKQMIDHIYGRENLITREGRPHVFIAELRMYIDYLEQQLQNQSDIQDLKQQEYIRMFGLNLLNGIRYYETLPLEDFHEKSEDTVSFTLSLAALKARLLVLVSEQVEA